MGKCISESKLIGVQKILLFLAVVCIPITVLPKKYIISTFSPVLSYFFVAIGLIIFCFWICRYNIKVNNKIKYFTLIFLIWGVISSIETTMDFQYYELIRNNDINKLLIVSSLLSKFGINFEYNFSLRVWIFIKEIFLLLKDFTFGYFFSIWVYYLYKDNWNEFYSMLRKGIYLTLFIIGLYSILKIGYLKEILLCTEVLKIINPYLYDPASGRGWWPPLLWNNQLRSIFPEPSFCGLYLAFSLPFIYIQYIEKDKIIILFSSMYFTFLVFLTKARTANLLYIGMLCCFIIFIVMYYRQYIKKFLVILLTGIIVFFTSIQFENIKLNEDSSSNTQVESVVTEYIHENVTSLSANKRSNTARYVVLISSFKTFLDHPIFGVGNALYGPYLVEKIPNWGKDDGEVKQWLQNMQDEGILKSPFPSFYEFMNRALYYGIMGLLIYITPIVFIVYKLTRTRRSKHGIKVIGLFISYIVCIAFMLGSSYASLTYYLSTGGLLVYLNESQKNEENEVA